eukprot:Tamp_40616.p1 GENE.Tamp_40616~~Tamp_40616.p1  ORF type:complete len:137 (-),score=15.27 Tamp_40616:38-448(-)
MVHGPWLRGMGLCGTLSCSSKVLVPAKQRQHAYMLSASEATHSRVALQRCQELVSELAANRTAVQQTLNLIGRGDMKGHGMERRLVRQVKSLGDKEAALAHECLQIQQSLRVRFRQSTIIQTLNVFEWRGNARQQR